MAKRNRFGNTVNGIAGFMQGFQQTYKATNDVLADFGLAEVEKTKPEQVMEYAQEDVVNDNVGPQPVAADGKEGERRPTSTGGKPKGQYKLFGTTQDKPFTDEQIAEAKARQRASVYRKFGKTEEAAREEDRIQQQKLRGMQMEEAGIRLEDLKGERDRKGKIKQIDATLGADFQKRLTNPDGTMREPTQQEISDNLRTRSMALFKAGEATEAGKVMGEYMTATKQRIELETAERTQAVGQALAGAQVGDYRGVGMVYDKYIHDGGKTVDIRQDGEGNVTIQRVGSDGQPLPPITRKANEVMTFVKTLVDPDAAGRVTEQGLRQDLLRAQIGVQKQNIDQGNLQMQAQRQSMSQSAASARRAAEDHSAQMEERKFTREQREQVRRVEQILTKDPAKVTPEEKAFVDGMERKARFGKLGDGTPFSFEAMRDKNGATTGFFVGDRRSGQGELLGLDSVPAGKLSAAPKPGAAAPAAPKAAAAVPPPEKRTKGQVYDTPRGKMRWMGTGWAPV